ncbi:hypothetical protein GALMADRAFT_235150 [Galerina marginata CBS 339.88]|uniref:F-box domain-containing protein n=1 Tax=Galerina marginata (strain CBS 339.88) TaxID=685588 RepID=A0A067U3H9_GALM3|nr:hypothetical protein GALMADRAFT_235150 [Galerina marginata CBS 339.88]
MIHDLPAELILHIFQFLNDNDLFNTSISCHLLNPFALAAFMQRTGSPDFRTSCTITPTRAGYTDVLTSLALYLHCESIGSLFCNLTTRQDYRETHSPASYVVDLTWNIKRVTRLIARLSSVGTVSIFIDEWVTHRWHLHSGEVREYVFAILRLVETCVVRGCTSFQISHPSPDIVVDSSKYELARRKGKVEKVSRFMPNPLPFRRKIEKYLKAASVSSSRSKLTILDLSCPFLFSPAFSKRTLDILKASPITSLTLSLTGQILVAEEQLHHKLMPAIARSVPNLQELKLDSKTEHLLSVIQNLYLFPRLQKISLGLIPFNTMPTTFLRTRVFALPHLRSFTGASDQAVYLFGWQGLSCSSLEFVNLLLDVHANSKSANITFAQHLSMLNANFSAMGISPCISVCMRKLVQVTPHPDYFAEWKKELSESFSTVSRLTFEFPVFHAIDPESQSWFFYPFLEVFCGLKQLTLIGRHYGRSVPEDGYSPLVAAVRAKYPNIAKVNFVVVQPKDPKTFHYHWSSHHNNSRHGGDRERTLPLFENKPIDSCACSHF